MTLPLAFLVPPALAEEEWETDCGPEDLSSPAYLLRHSDGSETNVTDLTGNVSEGDLISASFEVGPDCEGMEIRVATFTRDGNAHTSFDDATTTASDSANMGPALVPSCTFTVNVFTGTGPTTRLFDTDEGGDGECPENARMLAWRCPPVSAMARSEGTIALSWAAIHGATDYQVWRSTGETTMGTVIATLDASATTFTDDDTEAGTTYHYTVVALAGPHATTRDCVGATVTAIPEFPGLLIASAAGVAAVAAYVALRRR